MSNSLESPLSDQPMQQPHEAEEIRDGLTPIDEVSLEQSQQIADQPGWLRRHYMKLALGTFVAGSAASIAFSPTHKLLHEVESVAPWVGGGVVGTEIIWDAGAAIMLAGAGRKIGNPLKLRDRWNEASQQIVDSKVVKTGLAVNSVGAVGLTGVLVAGASQLPVETWPGAAALIGADLAGTIALRAPLVAAMRSNRQGEIKTAKPETESSKVIVRHARIEDMQRLADIDVVLFDKAYGTEVPNKQEIVSMLTKRYLNNPEWMFVAEMNGQVEGFVSAFQTSKPLEKFVSWEDSTADGTLDGKVDPNGKYVYVTNMTIKHEAVEQGAEDMLLANLFANGIARSTEYGYFVSRMPYFKRWAEANGIDTNNNSDIQKLAEGYFNMRDEKGRRYDKQLRMYEGYGFSLERLVGGGFDDEASLGFGVVAKADSPLAKHAHLRNSPLASRVFSRALREVAKHPKLLNKVL